MWYAVNLLFFIIASLTLTHKSPQRSGTGTAAVSEPWGTVCFSLSPLCYHLPTSTSIDRCACFFSDGGDCYSCCHVTDMRSRRTEALNEGEDWLNYAYAVSLDVSGENCLELTCHFSVWTVLEISILCVFLCDTKHLIWCFFLPQS